MPDIIDNTKVGEYIKSLLKERNMSQSDLAESLHISKSAISQNLNGKSSFDIQNLIRISEIFEISLDVLLSLKTDEDRNVISEYERLARRDFEEIKEVSTNKLNISIPDLYGKVFIEYVIDYDKKEVLQYLLSSRITLYQTTHSNSLDVIVKIIHYMITKDMKGFTNFIIEYVKIVGSFNIKDQELEKQVIKALNDYNDEQTIEDIFNTIVIQNIKVLKFLNMKRKLKILTKRQWIVIISKYHADRLLQVYLKTQDITDILDVAVHHCIQYGYTEGLKTIVKSLSEEQIIKYKHRGNIFQNTIEIVSQTNNLDIFKKYLKKNIYNNLTNLIITCIVDGKVDLYTYLILNRNKEIDFRRVGEKLIELNSNIILKEIAQYLQKDDMDYLFSKTKDSQLHTNKLLLELGAQVNTKYFNKCTSSKMNVLLESYRELGDEK